MLRPPNLPPIADVPPVDFSSYTDIGNSIGRMANVFGKISSVLQERNRKLKLRQAEEAGVRAGVTGVQELRRGVKETDEAFNTALTNTAMNRIEVGMRANLRQLEEDHASDPMLFRKKSTELIQAAKDEMNNLSPQHGIILQGRAEEIQAMALGRIQHTFLGERRDEASASIAELENTVLENISRRSMDLFNPDSDIATLAANDIATDWARLEAAWETPDPAGTGSLLSQPKVIERREKLLDSIYEDSIRALILHSDTPGKIGEAILDGSFEIPVIIGDESSEVIVSPIDELPFDTIESLVGFARQQQNRLDAEIRETRSEQKTFVEFKIQAIKAETEGGSVPTLQLSYDEALLFTGEPLSAAMLMNSLANDRKVAVEASQVNRESIYETNLRLSGIEVQGIDAPDDLHRLKTIETALTRKEAALRKDPVDFIIKSSTNASDAAEKFVNGEMTEVQYRKVLLDEQTRLSKGMLGFEPKLLSENESLDIVNTYSSLENEQEMVEFANTLQTRFAGYTGEVMEQTVKDGLPASVAMMVGLDSRTRESRLLARSIALGRTEMIKKLPKEMKSEEIDGFVVAQMGDFEAALPPGNDKLIADVRDAAQLLAYGVAAFDGLGEKASAKKAIDALIWSQWGVHNNVLLPSAVANDERIKAALTSKNFDLVIDDFADQFDPRGDSTLSRNQYVEFLKDGGRFVPAQDNSGLEMIDPIGRPVYLDTGEKFKLPWDELMSRGETSIVKKEAANVPPMIGRAFNTEEDIAARRENARKTKAREQELIHDLEYDTRDSDELHRLIRDGFNPNDLTASEVKAFKLERAQLYGALLDRGFDPRSIQRMSLQELRDAANKK